MTGFGLGGHATEMAVASDRTVVIDTEKLPVLPDVEEFASMGLIPGGLTGTGSLLRKPE